MGIQTAEWKSLIVVMPEATYFIVDHSQPERDPRSKYFDGMSGGPRGRGGSRGHGNGWRGKSSTNFGFREIGRGGFNNTLIGGVFNTFQGGRGRGVGNGLPIRGGVGSGTRRENSSSISEQDARIREDWFKENQHWIPKGPKADRQETEEASAVLQQDTQPENDRTKENQHLIPTEPKADRLAKSRQVNTKLVPEQDAHVKSDWIKGDQQSIPTEPKADRLAKSRQAETKQDLYRDAARRGYRLLRPTQKHPRLESKDARPTPTQRRSRSPEEEREFNSSFPPLPSSPAANVRPPPGNRPPTSVTPSAAPSARPAGRVACSTNPTERTFRKVSAGSTSTLSGAAEGDDGNLYDPNKTEEEKEKIRQEIHQKNMGIRYQWSGPNLDPQMRDVERG